MPVDAHPLAPNPLFSVHAAVDVTTCLTRRPTGIARYASNLVLALDEVQHEEGGRLTVVGKLSRFSHAEHFPPTRHAARRWWSEQLLPLRRPWDVVHYTGLVFPKRRHAVEVHTMHDLHALEGPSYQDPARRQRKVDEYLRIAERADAIACVSRHTANEVMRLLGVPAGRLHVVPLAVGAEFREASPQACQAVRARHGLQRPYFLYYGHASENKNIARILQAFAARAPELAGHQMVFIGGWGQEPQQAWQEQAAALKLGDAARHLGRVADADLVALLSAAEALVFPSLGEGFGLPILEAYACGTPVLTSLDGGSTAEVARGHATLVDPRDVGSIAAGLSRVVEHDEAQRAAAKAYAEAMNWTRVARDTLGVYRDVLNAGPSPAPTRLDQQAA